MGGWRLRLVLWSALASAVASGCADDELDGTCADRIRDGNETDVDCGGRCSPCGDGLLCVVDADCRSGQCGEDGRCQASSCTDGLRNGDESDVDCGGLVCGACAGGRACTRGADCLSRSCANEVCGEATCDDGRRNGAETDVDCGGEACGVCGEGLGCATGQDCASLRCGGGRCLASSCTDGLANGEESDLDCGGPECRRCLSGQACGVASDCYTGRCTEGRCVDATCGDGVLNGRESDVDCGRVCAPCAVGLVCRSGPDCDSGVCDLVNDRCAAPSCTDDLANGDETDVDCGAACPGCLTGQACATGADCRDQVCGPDGRCVAPRCDDLLANGDESDVDCGGSACAACTTGQTCRRATDCDSAVCDATARTCNAPSCTDRVKNGDETDVDCGGPDCGGCALFAACSTGSDCLSGNCSRSFCAPEGATVFGSNASYVGYTSRPTELPCPDPSVSGTEITTLTDFNSSTVDLPFLFEFFESSYRSAQIQLNGALSFDRAAVTYVTQSNLCDSPYRNTTFPDVFIAPFWDDLEATTAGDIFYETVGDAPSRTFVVQWKLPHDFATGDYDVRLALREGTSQIDICYVKTTSSSTLYTAGANATASVNEGESGAALVYSCNAANLSEGLVLTYVLR